VNLKNHFLSVDLRSFLIIVCTVAIVPGNSFAYILTSQAHPPASQAQTSAETAKISPGQLDSLVAPIALYPDPLLAQTLAASTYPLELVQLQQWLAKNPKLKDKELADAVAKQKWDPSIQAMAALPDVVKRLVDDIQWTADLGNAFLAQQSDVMDAVQRMRKKAKDKGTLKSTEQQKVETQVIEKKDVIVIQQANPQVVYVPSYDPVVVYGPPVYPYYPYPPIYYPPAGYYAAGMAISFGVGVAMGAAWGGGWGWGAGWGGNNVYINNNNNFIRNTNINGVNRNNVAVNRGGNTNWSHNPQHRGGTPYQDRATADRFGGTTRGDSLANRQAGAQQQLGRQGSNGAVGERTSNGSGLGARSTRADGGGGDSVGGRDVSRGGGGNGDAFSGGSRGSSGYNGSSARSSGSRGASSMGSAGGGFRRGGGGSRGGGGRRR
jgi:hypothetical protein